jgi:molybdopterin synthase sulfur carrier subunit
MSVRIHIPSTLREWAGNADREVLVPPGSVQDALTELAARHPAAYRGVCDETGAVRRHVNLFVNDFLVRDPADFERSLSPGDELFIMPAVSGG